MAEFVQSKGRDEDEFTAEVNLAAALEFQRFGEAVAIHIASKGELDGMSGWRISSDNDLFSQSGKAAEVKHVAKVNAQHAIDREATRIARTDNVGFPNDPTFDFVEIDEAAGQPVGIKNGKLTAGGQMKVHQRDERYRTLYKELFEKYKDAELVIPRDKFDAVLQDWDDQRQSLERQRDKLAGLGKTELAQQKQQEIDRINDARSRAKRSPVSSSEALEARTSPGTSVVKDALGVAHEAGMEGAKNGAMLGAGFSLLKNVVAVSRSGKDLGEAAADVLKDTSKAAAGAYATGALTAGAGGVLRSSSSQVLQNLGRSNAPAMAVQAAGMLAKSALDLASGRIAPEDFVKHVTTQGSLLAVSMTGSNFGAAVGTLVLPGVGTMVGGLVGGMAASLLSGHLHAALMRSVASLEASNALRQRVQAVCEQVRVRHVEYQTELYVVFDAFFTTKRAELKAGFDLISSASLEGQSIHEGLSLVSAALGKQLAFDSPSAFQQHLRSGRTLQF